MTWTVYGKLSQPKFMWSNSGYELNRLFIWNRVTCENFDQEFIPFSWTIEIKIVFQSILNSLNLVKLKNIFGGLHQCWWRMFETNCVGDRFKMLAKDSTNHQHNEKIANIMILSSTSLSLSPSKSHQYIVVTNITVPYLESSTLTCNISSTWTDFVSKWKWAGPSTMPLYISWMSCEYLAWILWEEWLRKCLPIKC